MARQIRYPEARRFNRCLLCLRETRWLALFLNCIIKYAHNHAGGRMTILVHENLHENSLSQLGAREYVLFPIVSLLSKR